VRGRIWLPPFTQIVATPAFVMDVWRHRIRPYISPRRVRSFLPPWLANLLTASVGAFDSPVYTVGAVDTMAYSVGALDVLADSVGASDSTVLTTGAQDKPALTTGAEDTIP
jgi:hypothetical protein